MNGQNNGSGATPTAAETKELLDSSIRSMLDVLSRVPEARVVVITPFGSIERSFVDLTHDQRRNLLGLLEITATVTLSTTADATSAGPQPARTTETDTASSGDSIAYQFTDGSQISADFIRTLRGKFVQWEGNYYQVLHFDLTDRSILIDRGPDPSRWVQLSEVLIPCPKLSQSP